MRKPVFGVSDQVPHKPGCTATEDGWRLEILYLGRREIVLSAKLICVFVFAYAKSRFSYNKAHLSVNHEEIIIICCSYFGADTFSPGIP